MNTFKKYFKKESVDGICAVLFLPTNAELGSAIINDYICVQLYDMPLSKTTCWFCMNRYSLPEHGKVILSVPSHMTSRVIGRKGINIKKIAKALEGRYVTIKSQ